MFAGPVPVNVGVVSDVMLSEFDRPVSLPGARSGADGAAGTALLIVTASPGPCDEGPFPAASVWTAVNV